jgi:hypothetical protein
MTRGKQPGHVEIAGGRTYLVTTAGFIAYDPRRRVQSLAPQWQRDLRRDTREQVL